MLFSFLVHAIVVIKSPVKRIIFIYFISLPPNKIILKKVALCHF